MLTKFALITFVLLATAYSVPYNWYVFANYWVPTYCSLLEVCLTNQTADVNYQFFNIHGLWPNYNIGFPQYCLNTTQFNEDYFNQTFLNQMENIWNGMNWTTYDFHNHEWTKHGTCWNDNVAYPSDQEKQNDYFTRIVDLALTANIYSTLSVNGILPSEDGQQLLQFQQVFDTHYGANTYDLQCQQDSDGDQYLIAVYFCVSLNYEIMTCPSDFDMGGDCSAEMIYYPANIFTTPSEF